MCSTLKYFPQFPDYHLRYDMKMMVSTGNKYDTCCTCITAFEIHISFGVH